MTFEKGEQVVVKVNGTHQVGVVNSRTRLKKGWSYSVKLENGKLIESCSVNKELSECYIIRGLTKSFNNANGTQEKVYSTQEESAE
jgi:hypothetical protein